MIQKAKSIVKTIYEKISPILTQALILRMIGAYCLTVSVIRLSADEDFTKLEAFADAPILYAAVIFAATTLLFTLIVTFTKFVNADRYLLLPAFGLYTVLLADDIPNTWFVFAFSCLWAILFCYYASKGWLTLRFSVRKLRFSFGTIPAVAALSACIAGFIIVLSIQGVMRYKTFSSPNFDFGIFCNMYYHMAKDLSAVTTCERDTLLSHFAVHVSPIYYVLLPFYWIFPRPETLQVAQAVLLGSAAVPAYLIARKYRLSPARSLICAAMLLLCPTVGNGTNYDFHENCFLLPLLMWTFCFFEKEKYVPYAVFALLTLTVKEDAAMYIVFFSLYAVLGRKKVVCGVVSAAVAVGYFVLVLSWLTKSGQGVMDTRFSNYIVNDGGLAEAVKNVLADPAYVFTQLFVDRSGPSLQKVLYVLYALAPFAFLPVAAKKPARLLLLLPMLLINLMTTYAYQFDIGFQYSFGSTAFLCYAAIMNVSDMKPVQAKTALCTGLVLSMLCFYTTSFNRAKDYYKRYTENPEQYTAVEEALAKIPKEASVVCTTFLLPHLSDRDEIYESEYHDPASAELPDYVILSVTSRWDQANKSIADYTALGYTEQEYVTYNERDLVLIMTRPEGER